ncbi:MAG TPA: hypothetical protein VLU43_10570 [Anaeromyxobacteraceae bacterium]|nr:hypothetical protein [Anaeromyxobacteraceae bacterium]
MVSRVVVAASAAAALLASAAVPAQADDDDYGSSRRNTLRLQVGTGGVSSGYTCVQYSGGYCGNYYNLSTVPLTLSAGVDFGVKYMAISPGFTWLSTPFASRNVNVYQPSLDLRWASRGGSVGSRVSLGFGMPITQNGSVGFSTRLGFGGSFGPRDGTTLGLDCYIGWSNISGVNIGSLIVALGPEFHF